jgi:hypothetical protein
VFCPVQQIAGIHTGDMEISEGVHSRKQSGDEQMVKKELL